MGRGIFIVRVYSLSLIMSSRRETLSLLRCCSVCCVWFGALTQARKSHSSSFTGKGDSTVHDRDMIQACRGVDFKGGQIRHSSPSCTSSKFDRHPVVHDLNRWRYRERVVRHGWIVSASTDFVPGGWIVVDKGEAK